MSLSWVTKSAHLTRYAAALWSRAPGALCSFDEMTTGLSGVPYDDVRQSGSACLAE